MNDIRPFRGWRFDEQVAGPLSSLLCPPYDVISPVDQLALHARSPYNMVRLELGLEYPEDRPGSNRYSRSAEILDSWIARGVLKTESEPVLYLYKQSFSHQGQTLSRLGVFARLRLTPWSDGVVLPHEETLSGPKIDRLNLMRATACNLSSVYLLFDDQSRTASSLMAGIASGPPDLEAQTENGQAHYLWVVYGETMARLVEALRFPQLYMADGHHRYETALSYRDEIAHNQQAGADSPYNFVMALLVDAADPGLVVLPTHRLLHGVEEGRLAGLVDSISEHFELIRLTVNGSDPVAVSDALLNGIAPSGSVDHAIALYLGGPEAHILRLRRAESALSPRGRPILDVDLLHESILEKLLGIGAEELRAGGMVTYTRDATEAISAVSAGSAQAAFLLNPTRVEQVLETARAGGRMPQKSTYFYPKPETGLVINPLV